MEARRYKVKLNSNDKIEELLQEIYEQACRQLTEIQNEMNKLMNSTNLGDISIDEKAKYSKAMHDFIGDKNRAITTKFDIAKFMGEIVKHNGDANAAINDPNIGKIGVLDITKLRDELSKGSNEMTNSYDLK